MIEYLIVLGKLLNEDDSVPDTYRNRLDKVVEVYMQKKNEGIESKIIISGGSRDNRKTEAKGGFEYMKREYVFENFIEGKNVILEEASLDTVGNAVFTKMIIIGDENKNPVIVTSNDHIERTENIFKHILGYDFKPTFVSAATRFSDDDLKKIKIREDKKMQEINRFFDKYKVGVGDHERAIYGLRNHMGYVILDS